jgi:hypothetical protein
MPEREDIVSLPQHSECSERENLVDCFWTGKNVREGRSMRTGGDEGRRNYSARE